MIYDLKFEAFLKEIVVCEFVTIREREESGNGRVRVRAEKRKTPFFFLC
jgi:hypothetical protein